MGQELDTNQSNSEDQNFERHKHNKPRSQKDRDGRMKPKPTGNAARDRNMDDDGGALGRNNMGDKSGR